MRTVDDFIKSLPRIGEVKARFFVNGIEFDNAKDMALYCVLDIKQETGEIEDFLWDPRKRMFAVVYPDGRIRIERAEGY